MRLGSVRLSAFVRSLATVARPRVLLGIERYVSCLWSSCDDSCAAVVTSDRKILSSVVLKQDHTETQGIHPLYAARGHHTNVPIAIARALDEAHVSYAELDGLAVTQGPGMPGCLAVGMAAGKALSTVLSKPIVYVHHMRGRCLHFMQRTP